MNIIQRLSAKSQIALGQSGLLVSLVLLAVMLGLVPDRSSAIRDGRAALAEALAANSAAFITYSDLQRIEADLSLVVTRNKDILSAGLRRTDGSLATSVGEHEQHWQAMSGEYSTDVQLRVPISTAEQRWGEVELRFTALQAPGLLGVLQTPWVQLSLFFGIFSFVLFYFYLGKMLTQLDPSQAIPGRVRSALDTMAEGLLVLDRKQQIVLANHAFANMLGKHADELTGLRADLLPWIITDAASAETRDYPWVRAIKEGVAQTNKIMRLELSAASQRTFMLNCSPVLGSKGKYAGVLVSFDDITELEEKEIELRKSKEEAEAANAAKSVFLSNMSHEIRTPMNAVLGFTELLQRGYGKTSEDSNKYLQTIHSSGKHLLNLINDILDLSKVEAGRMEIEKIRFAAHEVLAETVQVLNVKAQEKGISLEFKPEGNVPETILSDPSRFRQIITNLLGNAIKFTDTGGVTVKLKLAEDDLLSVDIIDTGIGMPQDRLESIFDPFVQADTSVARRFGGTGLGLSISKGFAEALGGAIKVTSQPGQGSTFSISIDTGPLEGIPLLSAEQLSFSVTQAQQTEIQHWLFPPARILVVDDGVENRQLVKLVLEENGLQVDEAENGQVGFDRATAISYAVILMDVQMPVMDGFTATKMLRQSGMQTPIVALTANAMKGFEQECLAAGYTSYMSKPIDIDALLASLAEFVGATKAAATSVQQAPILLEEAANDAADTGSSTPIISRLAAQDSRFQRLIEQFSERLDLQLQAMDLAWTQKNYTELANLAHWLKGAGGTVGFDVFTTPADELEQFAKSQQDELIETALGMIHSLSDRLAIDNETQCDMTAVRSCHAAENTDMQLPEETGAAKPVSADCGAGTVAKVPAFPPPAADAPLVGPPNSESCIGSEPLISRYADDPRLQPLIKKFCDRVGMQLALMRQRWEKQQFEELADLAHWLKGAGGTMGFDAFNEPASELEKFAKESATDEIEPLLTQLEVLAGRMVSAEATTAAPENIRSTG